MNTLPLHIVKQTKTTITLGWPLQPGCEGYEYLVDGVRSNTWDGTKTQANFKATAKKIIVNALGITAQGVWPQATPPVTPPQPPIHDATAFGPPPAQTIGLNVTGAPGTFTDYLSAGTYDSAVLSGPSQGGSVFKRFQLDKAASIGSGPGYGRHAYYVKSPNITCSDFAVTMDPNAPDVGSGWSVRYAGFSLDRFSFDGFWFASLFDDDPSHGPGKAWFSNGTAKFANPYAAILYDAQIRYDVHLTNIAFTGPLDMVMTLDQGSAQPSAVVVNGCTMNGKPITKAMFANVTPGLITIDGTPPPPTNKLPWFSYIVPDPIVQSLPAVWKDMPGIGAFCGAEDPSTLNYLKANGVPAFATLGATDSNGKPTITDAQAVADAKAAIATGITPLIFMLADEPGKVNGNPTSAAAWLKSRVTAMRGAGITNRLAITYYDIDSIQAFSVINDPASTNRFTIIGDLYPGQTDNLNWRSGWESYITALMAATVGMGFDTGTILGDFGDGGFTTPTPAQLADYIATGKAGDGKGHEADVMGVYGWGYGSVPEWIYQQIAAAMGT